MLSINLSDGPPLQVKKKKINNGALKIYQFAMISESCPQTLEACLFY